MIVCNVTNTSLEPTIDLITYESNKLFVGNGTSDDDDYDYDCMMMMMMMMMMMHQYVM
jgi:hypothetical protein